MRSNEERLGDILQAIDRIEQFWANPDLPDDMRHDAVLYNLLVIGEAAKALSPEVTARAPGYLWDGPIRMRNFVAHGYFLIDLGIVGAVVEKELPKMRTVVEELLQS